MDGAWSFVTNNIETINVPIGTDVEGKNIVSLQKADLVTIVDASFVYPKEKSIIDKEVKAAIVRVAYNCQSNKCNFEQALLKIQQGQEAGELKGLGVNKLSEILVGTIADNPEIFPSAALGGYILQSTGAAFLVLENKTQNFSNPSPRYGFIDLNEVRKKLILQSMHNREVRSDNVWKASTLAGFLYIVYRLRK